MRLFGLISDTHGVLRPQAIQALQGVDHIIHAGDVGPRDILERLTAIAPVTAVRGNVDRAEWCGDLPLNATLETPRGQLYVVHDLASITEIPPGVAFVVYGHSHKTRHELRGGVTYINPGSAGPRRFKLPITLARLQIDHARYSLDFINVEKFAPNYTPRKTNKTSSDYNPSLKGVRLLEMRRSTAAVMTSGAVLGGVSAMAAYGTLAKSSQLFGPSVFRGAGTRRSLALTFDDGPSESTMELLEYLDREDIKATFFMCGMNVRRLPGIAGRVAANGHEIGNHSYSHPYLLFKSSSFMEREFGIAQKIIEDETGITPLLLRPPYGCRWFGLANVQRRLSLLGVLWTVIGNDWKWPRERIAERVVRLASPGGIVCLHDGRTIERQPDVSETLAALRMLVPVLKDQGYRFETIGQILS